MAVKDLVSGVLAESITTSTTNVLVTIAQSIGRPGILSFFPTPPFYITIMPKSPAVGVANRLDSEILQVTAVGNDQVGNAALTCVRGQRDTTAKAFEAGSIVTVGVYTDDAVLLGGTGTTETETPWIKATDIVWASFCPGFVKMLTMPTVATINVTQSWANITLGSPVTVSGLDPNGSYAFVATNQYAESAGTGEFRLVATGATEVSCNSYHTGMLESVSYLHFPIKPNSSGNIVFKRYYRGETGNVRCGEIKGLIIRVG